MLEESVMKKMILKVSLLAFLTFGITSGYVEKNQLQNTYQEHFWKGQQIASCAQKEYEYLHGFCSIEGLKAHWITLERLLGTFPTKETMLGSIESYPFFREGPVCLKGHLLKNFEIFKRGDEFEISNGVGLRHFAMRELSIGDRTYPVLYNGDRRVYQDISAFIRSCLDYNFFA